MAEDPGNELGHGVFSGLERRSRCRASRPSRMVSVKSVKYRPFFADLRPQLSARPRCRRTVRESGSPNTASRRLRRSSISGVHDVTHLFGLREYAVRDKMRGRARLKLNVHLDLLGPLFMEHAEAQVNGLLDLHAFLDRDRGADAAHRLPGVDRRSLQRPACSGYYASLRRGGPYPYRRATPLSPPASP